MKESPSSAASFYVQAGGRNYLIGTGFKPYEGGII